MLEGVDTVDVFSEKLISHSIEENSLLNLALPIVGDVGKLCIQEPGAGKFKE